MYPPIISIIVRISSKNQAFFEEKHIETVKSVGNGPYGGDCPRAIMAIVFNQLVMIFILPTSSG